MARLLLLLALSASLGSCFFGERRLNSPIDADAIAQLQVGVSTAMDVTEALGAPEQVVELGTNSAWLYRHNHEKNTGLFLLIVGLYGEDTQSDRVWTFFNEQGVLTHVGATLQADEAEFQLPGF